MKVGLISDIHGNSPALKAALTALQGEVERIFFLGDLVGYYPFVNECVDQWDADLIDGVLGNHDQILLDCLAQKKPPDESYRARYGSALTRSWESLSSKSRVLLESWPHQRSVKLGTTSVALFHGAPWDPLSGRVYPDLTDWSGFAQCAEEVIVLGHTHYPMIKTWQGKLIVNPGSVGQPRNSSGGADFAILDVLKGSATLHRAVYDASTVITDAQRHDPALIYLTEVLTR
jgi:putative phosphoesterase